MHLTAVVRSSFGIELRASFLHAILVLVVGIGIGVTLPMPMRLGSGSKQLGVESQQSSPYRRVPKASRISPRKGNSPAGESESTI